jgi:hypothetical protein
VPFLGLHSYPWTIHWLSRRWLVNLLKVSQPLRLELYEDRWLSLSFDHSYQSREQVIIIAFEKLGINLVFQNIVKNIRFLTDPNIQYLINVTSSDRSDYRGLDSSHQPSIVLNVTAVATAFIPLVPQASKPRRGVFNHRSQPCTYNEPSFYHNFPEKQCADKMVLLG